MCSSLSMENNMILIDTRIAPKIHWYLAIILQLPCQYESVQKQLLRY